MLPWWLRAVVSAAVAAVLLAFVPIDQVWDAIRRVNPWIWAASVGVFVAGHSLNAMKLRVLLGAGRASAAACLRAHFAGLAANLGLPGVAGGDVVRASYLAPSTGTARVTVAAVADRLLDLLVLFLIALLAVRTAGLPTTLRASAWPRPAWLIAIGVVAVVAALAVWRRVRRSAVRASVREAASSLLARPRAVALAMTISMGVQSAFVLTNVWLASEVGVGIELAPWFLAWTGAKLSAVLPISLGGIGVREATLVSVLVTYGAPADGVLAAGILWEGALVVGSASGFLATQLGRR